MNFRDLEYIVETAQTLNFTQAAQNCNVSQPSLSAQIKKIEQELEAPLFHRNKRSVSLTSYGQAFVERAKQILRLQRDIQTLAHSGESALEGKLRLGGIITIAPYIFPELVRRFKKAIPQIDLELKEAKTDGLLKDLLDNKIDVALISLPTDHHVFESGFLFSEDFYLAVSKNHPLARKKAIEDKDLESQELILLEEGHCFRAQALEVCSSTWAKENQVFTATSLETIRQFVAKGDGMTLMPKMAIQKQDGMVYIPLKNKKFTRDIGLVWRKNSSQKSKIEKLMAFMRDKKE